MKIVIERLGHQGDGIGRGPDGPVFAPLTLPGEEVEGEVVAGRLGQPLLHGRDRVVAGRLGEPALRPLLQGLRADTALLCLYDSDGFYETTVGALVRAALEELK